MTHNFFQPFEADLPFDAALQVLREATNGADDGEIFAERKRAEMLSFDDGRLKMASYDATEGFGLRAVKGEVTGFAHSSAQRALDHVRYRQSRYQPEKGPVNQGVALTAFVAMRVVFFLANAMVWSPFSLLFQKFNSHK